MASNSKKELIDTQIAAALAEEENKASNPDTGETENPDTGELVQLSELMADFAKRTCMLSLNYDEDYDTEVENDT